MFSREHREIDDDGRATFIYQPGDLEKSARFAMFTFTDALRHWATYYDAAPQRLQNEINSIEDRLTELSVLIDRPS
jgi:hypothetical protein